MIEGDAPIPFRLRAAAAAFGLAAGIYHRGYDRGRLGVERLPVPVLSVGNLEAGGTGKTPAVLALALASLAAGVKPAILTRGYRGRRSGVLRGGAWEDASPAIATESGDEALLVSRALPGVPVVVGKNRARGGRALLAREPDVDLFLLDDGFQHRRLYRDRDLVLLDALRPFGNGRLLPAGTLREPPAALARAHHLLLGVPDPETPVPAETVRLLALAAPRTGSTRVWSVPVGIRPLTGESRAWDGDRAAIAVAGIARPERFRSTLASMGVGVHAWRPFPDHHRFRPAEIAALEEEAKRGGAVLITTAKDAVRIEPLVRPGAPWWVLEIELRSERGWEALLREAVPASPL